MKKIVLVLIVAGAFYLAGYAQSREKRIEITASDEIVLQTGKSLIQLKKDGTILIKGTDITIVGDNNMAVKAGNKVILKGSKMGEN